MYTFLIFQLIILKKHCIIILSFLKGRKSSEKTRLIFFGNLMEKITHKIKIAGNTYNVTCDETPEYMSKLAHEVDVKIDKILSGSTISTTQAAVIAALEFADLSKKSDSSSLELREKLKISLEDVAKARKEADFYKRELERLQGKKAEENEKNPALW